MTSSPSVQTVGAQRRVSVASIDLTEGEDTHPVRPPVSQQRAEKRQHIIDLARHDTKSGSRDSKPREDSDRSGLSVDLTSDSVDLTRRLVDSGRKLVDLTRDDSVDLTGARSVDLTDDLVDLTRDAAAQKKLDDDVQLIRSFPGYVRIRNPRLA